MSTLSVTNIITANDTTDLTLKTGNTSGPELVLSANGATSLNNIQTLSVGNSTVNTVMTSTNLSVGNSTVNTAISSGNIAINGQNISPTMSFRNVIINGNFDFWQRGTSTTTAGYLADRFLTGATGSTFTTSRQSFILGQTDVPNNPTYWSRTVVVSSAGASNFVVYQHRVENAATLSGQPVTLSFYAKADASKNIAVEFAQNFGSGGSPSTQVNEIGVTTCALTTSWQKFTVTATLPSISGKTLGTSSDDKLFVFFWLDAGSNWNARTNSLGQQSGTFDIAQVQLEQGSVATPFELRPLGTELALCQRYYCVTIGSVRAYAGGSGHVYENAVYWPVTMRAAPSAAVSGGVVGGPITSNLLVSATVYGITNQIVSSGAGDMYAQNRTINASAEL